MTLDQIALEYAQLGESMTGANPQQKKDLLAEMEKYRIRGMAAARNTAEWFEAVTKAGDQVRAHTVEFTGDSVFAFRM